jgi:predicted aldo/keto reductase-like oxidoreductase
VKRREFLGAVTVSAAAPLAAGAAGPSDAPEAPTQLPKPPQTKRGDMIYRKLGRTPEEVSLLGLGGFHIGTQKDESESIKIIRSAIDAGINFMDNCWDYHDGGSEIRMGKALKDGYRKKVFLMTKIDGRTKSEAARQIDQCLKRLQTDHIDLLQHHEILRLEDPDRIFAPGGAQEAVEAAKKAGKVRYVGFTGHKDPLVHLRMLEVARQHDYHFDTAQMPLNVLDAHFRSFAHQAVPALLREGVAVLGMKSMANGLVFKTNTATPVECLHYAMSLPTSVVIAGMDSTKILKQGLDAVKSFRPLSAEQAAALLAKTARVAKTGRYEPFKTGNGFDGTARHPEWLGRADVGPG